MQLEWQREIVRKGKFVEKLRREVDSPLGLVSDICYYPVIDGTRKYGFGIHRFMFLGMFWSEQAIAKPYCCNRKSFKNLDEAKAYIETLLFLEEETIN